MAMETVTVSSQSDPSADHLVCGEPRWWTVLPPLDRSLTNHWRRWAGGPDGARTLRHWDRYPELADWTVDELAEPRAGDKEVNEMQVRLVRLAQGGSSRAFATLLTQLRPGLVRLARSAVRWPWTLVHSHHEACIEVQAVFAETALTLDVERRRSRIAANLVNDTRQQLWRSSPAGWASGNPGWLSPSQDPAPDGSMVDPSIDRVETMVDLGNWLRSHLCENVADRSPSQSATVEMAYLAWIEEYRLSEIADQMGRTPGAVANRLHRLRTQLRSNGETLAY